MLSERSPTLIQLVQKTPFASTGTATMENMRRFLTKLEIELPYEPSVPLLGIHTEGTRIERDMCTPNVHCSTVYNS